MNGNPIRPKLLTYDQKVGENRKRLFLIELLQFVSLRT
jgi:hypothetical protein